MPRVGNDLTFRFRMLKSRTPLYHAEDHRFYWSHCWYCGIELVYDKNAKKLKANSFTRDHVVPECHGGGRGLNTVPACNSCNKRKGDMSLEKWRSVLNKGNGKLFFGERKEEEARAKLDAKTIRLPLEAQIHSIMPQLFEFKPRPLKCHVIREQVLHTPLSRILRRFFK